MLQHIPMTADRGIERAEGSLFQAARYSESSLCSRHRGDERESWKGLSLPWWSPRHPAGWGSEVEGRRGRGGRGENVGRDVSKCRFHSRRESSDHGGRQSQLGCKLALVFVLGWSNDVLTFMELT